MLSIKLSIEILPKGKLVIKSNTKQVVTSKAGLLTITHIRTKKTIAIPTSNLKEEFHKQLQLLKSGNHYCSALQYLYDTEAEISQDPTYAFSYNIKLENEKLNRFQMWDNFVSLNMNRQLVQYSSTKHKNLHSMEVKTLDLIKLEQTSNYQFHPLDQILNCGHVGYSNYSGIYRIVFNQSGREYIYVGKSYFIAYRWAWHLKDMIGGKHHNPFIRESINLALYNRVNSTLNFEVLEYTNHMTAGLIPLESQWAAKYSHNLISNHDF